MFSNIKHFDNIALAGMKSVMTYAARGKTITLTRLYAAGITVILLQMVLRLEPLSMLFSVRKLRKWHIPFSHLGFRTTLPRWTT